MFSIKGISSVEMDLLKKYLIPREIPKNVVLYDSTNDAVSMFFVELGAIKLVHRRASDGKDDSVQGIVKPGGFCGEEAVLAERVKYQYTAITHESSMVLELSKTALHQLMMESMSSGTKILLGISKSYREAMTAPEQTAKIIAFYSPKDGVGKTTMAINTAVRLAKAKKRVAFLDCDFQFGNSHIYLGVSPFPNVGRLVQMEEHLQYDRIKLYFQRKFDLDILMCPDLPQEAELITRSNLNQIIMEMGKNYDYLVIDVQCYLDNLSLFLWDNAERLVLVSLPEIASLTRIHRLFKVFERLNYPREKFAFLLNRFTKDDGEFLKEAKKIVPNDTFPISECTGTCQKAQLSGMPFLVSNPESPLGKDLEVFVQTLLGEQKAQQKMEKGGIFSRLKSMFA